MFLLFFSKKSASLQTNSGHFTTPLLFSLFIILLFFRKSYNGYIAVLELIYINILFGYFDVFEQEPQLSSSEVFDVHKKIFTL